MRGINEVLLHRAVRRIAILLTAISSAWIAWGQTQTEPSWPVQFQVVQSEASTFVFFVHQPGAIDVQATTQGAPAKLILVGPLPQPVQQVGSGNLRLTYNVTAADVQRGSVWGVRIMEASPLSPILNQPLRTTISGSVVVRHPPADPQRAQAEIQRTKTVVQQGRAQPVQPRPDTLTPKKAAYAKLLADQQAVQKQQLTTMIVRRAPAGPSKLPPASPLTPGAARTPPSVRTGGGGQNGGGGGNGPGGDVGGGTAPAAVPQITKLSANQGKPGDVLLITGSGFGSNTGEVHFIINRGMDAKATVIDYWSDNQIMAYVPDASGILPFPQGQMYVQPAGGQKSALLAFSFYPALDFAQLLPDYNTSDMKLDPYGIDSLFPISHVDSGDLFPRAGYDVFYPKTSLKNGWVVDSVDVQLLRQHCQYFGDANANLVAAVIGSPSPYVQVRWWLNSACDVQYKPIITIKGPKGVPYQ